MQMGLWPRPGMGDVGLTGWRARRGLSLFWGINEAFDGRGLRPAVMRPCSEAELSHGIQETELKRLKELFSKLCSGFSRACHMSKDGIKGQRGRIPSVVGLGRGEGAGGGMAG